MDYNSSANVHINVIDDKSLSVVDKIVYFVLCFHADSKTRQCSPKVALIAARASCSEGAVRKSLATLEKRGIIHRKFRYVNHRQISSLYTVISAEANYHSGDFIPSQNNRVEAEYLNAPDNEVASNSTVLEHTCSIGGTENTGDTKMRAGQYQDEGYGVHQDEGVKKNLRIFNNSLKGEACHPTSAENESSSGNPEECTNQEEAKNSLTGEALLPIPQLQEPEEQQEKPQATENTQDSIAEDPVIKAETHTDTEKPEGGACLPAPAEQEEKTLTQDEKLRRYYELRRKCEEEHRKAEAEACLPAPAENETTLEESKAPQTEGSTLPDYLIQQYRRIRQEQNIVDFRPEDTLANGLQKFMTRKPPVIKAECEEATQTLLAKSELADNTPVANSECVEYRDTPVAKTEPMETSNSPEVMDRHMNADNTSKPAETSNTPVAKDEPPAPKEADEPAETSNKPVDKGKYSGGGNSKDVYPIDYAPDIMRPTAEYFLFKTGRKGLRWEEVSVLRKLSATQYPTRVQKEIERACERFRKRNQSLLCLTLMYIWAALKNQPTWGRKAKKKVETPTAEETAKREAEIRARIEELQDELGIYMDERGNIIERKREDKS